ncbi:hypothetical protein DSM43518_02664 [Mycobacterium marinum]|nr:hypothetical protein DSM43518_02664 [Mycobacterium marinum]RFZ22302.1 hypothetical protein DSM44344_03452 [Mycobacterium marinum]RFZ46515.1 hypothetical protein MSS4_03500 [Mycobacterium marinum]RFZ55985.1 hypothetical protein MSS2_01987 [Mycobacterium marinum]
MQVWGAMHDLFGHHDQPPTMEQGPEDFQDRDIEAVGVPLRPDTVYSDV